MRRSSLAALVLLASCAAPTPELDGGLPDADAGAVGDAGVDAGEGPLLASEYCERTVDVFCPYYLRCGRILAASLEECRATFLETCNARYEQRYVDLEDAGLLALSRTGLEACRAHLETVACERQLTDLLGPCGATWEGTQPAGAPCGLDVQSFTCAPGTACVLGLDLCGTCTPAAEAGQACGDGGTCGADLACVAGTCVMRRQVGETCSASQPCVVGAGCPSGTCTGPTVVGEGDACDQAHRCPYRSACIGGRCLRAGLLGEDCTGRTCASGRCVTEGTAKTCRPYLAPGAACASAAECQSASCVQGTCRPLPDACFQ